MEHSQPIPPFHTTTAAAAARRVSNESEPGYPSFGNIVVANEHAYSSSGGSRSPRSSQRRSSPSQVELHGQITAHGNVRKLVEHNYHDYSQVPAPSSGDGTSNEQQPTTVFVTRGGTATLFPLKLYGMLDDAMSADPSRDRQLPGVPNGQILSQIVCFQPHGRAFKVQDVNLFKECVLPVYFGKMKYSSFLRQLNLCKFLALNPYVLSFLYFQIYLLILISHIISSIYILIHTSTDGFTRISRGADKGGYYHELFLQHRQYLVYRIQRMKVKGSGTRAAANPDQEPNFYAMTYMRDIPFPTGNSSSASSLPELNPQLVASAHKQANNNNDKDNANKKREATTTKAGQPTSEADDILDDDMLFEPLPVGITPVARSTHRQVSMTSGDLMDSHSSLDSFNLDAVECGDDVMAGVADDIDLDLSMLEDLLADEPSDYMREENDSTKAVAPSPTVSFAPKVEPTPMAVPPPLMSHAAAARYNAAFARAEPVAAAPTFAAPPPSAPAVSNFDTSEITFLQSLFAAEAVSAMPMSPIKVAAAAKFAAAGNSTTKTHMDASANAQADYRNNVATNGGRSRFQNTRAARTA